MRAFMVMSHTNHKSFMCPQSAASEKRFGCQGLRCAAFRVYHPIGGTIPELIKDRTFVCGLLKSSVSIVQLNIQELISTEKTNLKIDDECII